MNEHRATLGTGRSRVAARRVAAVAVMALLVATTACGSDSDGASDTGDKATTTVGGTGSDDTTPGGDGPAGEASSVEATLTDEAIEGLPEEIPAGVVEVAVTDETTDEGAGGDLNFSRVEEGTTAEGFKDGLTPLFEGGPFPKYLLDNAGTVGEGGSILLEEGQYIVWSDKASNLDRESTLEDITTAPLIVTAGGDDATLPEGDGSITASDYEFEVDVPGGGGTITFTNASEEQFHHVILADFGTNDPDVVEEKLAEIIQSEGEMPEGIEGEPDFEAGATGVFGPGSSGTFEAELTEGNTYVALCFIQDVTGGAPHAIAHNMAEVFVAGG